MIGQSSVLTTLLMLLYRWLSIRIEKLPESDVLFNQSYTFRLPLYSREGGIITRPDGEPRQTLIAARVSPCRVLMLLAHILSTFPALLLYP